MELLLHTDMLASYSRLLRVSGRQVQQRPGRSSTEAAIELLSEVADLLGALEPAFMGLQLRDAGRASLVAATFPVKLSTSSILDAWATCFLQLEASGECSSKQAAALLRAFGEAVERLDAVYAAVGMAFYQDAGTGILFLLSAHVVRAVAAMNGGTTYGMPADAPQVPLLAPDGAVIRTDWGGTLDPTVLKVALRCWEQQLGACYDRAAPAASAASPPFHQTATFDICIRLLNAAVATSMAPAAAAQRQQQRRRSGPVLLLRSSGCEVARLALDQAVEALRQLMRRSPAGVQPEHVERLQALWAAFMRALDAALESASRCVTDAAAGSLAAGGKGAAVRDGSTNSIKSLTISGDWSGFSRVAVGDLVPTAAGPPAQLSPEAEAALSAGVLSRMERMMRLQVRPVKLLCGVTTWTQLVMFGPAGHVAALIATAAKYVRSGVLYVEQQRKRRPKQLSGNLKIYSAYLPQGMTAAADFLTAAVSWLTWTESQYVVRSSSASHIIGMGGSFDSADSAAGSYSRDAVGGVESDGRIGGGTDGGAGHGAGGSSTNSGRSNSGGGRSGGSSGSSAPGTQQLAELTSFALVRLLPAVSKAVQCFESSAYEYFGSHSKQMTDMFWPLHIVLRSCLALLIMAVPAGAADAPPVDPAAQPAAVADSIVAAQWRQLLLHEVDLMGLLEAAAKALITCNDSFKQHYLPACRETFAKVFCLARVVFPDAMNAAMARGQGAPSSGGREGAGASAGEGGGAGMGASVDGGEATPSGSAGGGAGGLGGHPRAYLTLDTIVKLLGPSDGDPLDTAINMIPPYVKQVRQPEQGVGVTWAAALAAALPPPDDVRRRIAAHCCANPACVNLEGPSEASLPQ